MVDLHYKPGTSQEEVADAVRHFRVEDIIEREIAAGQRFGPMHRQWQLERAPEHVLRMLDYARHEPGLLMASQTFTTPGASKPALSSFSAIATTTTESCLWNSTVTTALQTTYAPIPALTMRPGVKYQVRFGGTIAVTATPTCIWTPRVGPNSTAANAANISLGASPTITSVASLNHPFYGEFEFEVRSLGLIASGTTCAGGGWVAYGNASAAATVAVMGGTIPTTVDDTVLTGMLVNLTWGASSGSNTCTCTWMDFVDN